MKRWCRIAACVRFCVSPIWFYYFSHGGEWKVGKKYNCTTYPHIYPILMGIFSVAILWFEYVFHVSVCVFIYFYCFSWSRFRLFAFFVASFRTTRISHIIYFRHSWESLHMQRSKTWRKISLTMYRIAVFIVMVIVYCRIYTHDIYAWCWWWWRAYVNIAEFIYLSNYLVRFSWKWCFQPCQTCVCKWTRVWDDLASVWPVPTRDTVSDINGFNIHFHNR